MVVRRDLNPFFLLQFFKNVFNVKIYLFLLYTKYRNHIKWRVSKYQKETEINSNNYEESKTFKVRIEISLLSHTAFHTNVIINSFETD